MSGVGAGQKDPLDPTDAEKGEDLSRLSIVKGGNS